MFKRAGLILVATTVWAAAAGAQVATSELTPAAVRLFNARSAVKPMHTIVPENPAALVWGAPSRIGGGVIDGEKVDAVDGTSDSYEGTFGGVRFVTQTAAFAAATLDYEVLFPQPATPLPPPGPTSPTLQRRRTSLGLAFSYPDWLGWGVASHSEERLDAPPPPNGAVQIETDAITGGVSLNLGDTLFLGAAYGEEDATRLLPQPAAAAKRSYVMGGVALRGTGFLIWRAEADLFVYDDFEAGSGANVGGGYELMLGSLDLVLGSWLLAFSAFEVSKALPGVTDRTEGTTVDFGLAPLQGLTITGRLERSEFLLDGVSVSEEEVVSAAITLQF